MVLRTEGRAGRDVALEFCRARSGHELTGGKQGWGVKDAFFPMSIPANAWNEINWVIEGIDSKYDIEDIYNRLTSSEGYNEYRSVMEALNNEYEGCSLGPDAKLHSSENNTFWHKFRNAVATSAGKMLESSCVVWPIPEPLAEEVWLVR